MYTNPNTAIGYPPAAARITDVQLANAIHQIEAQRRELDDARQGLRLAVKWARERGVPVTALADAAGVTRATIYAWLS